MQLSDIFLGLGNETFLELMRSVTMGKLRTYQLFERMKARAHLSKMNSETFRKAAPRLWSRLEAHEEEVAQDLAQAILVSHLGLIIPVLNLLGVPHEEGFFSKNIDATQYLTEGWQQRVWDEFHGRFERAPLLFYINHLGWELAKSEQLFQPAG